MIHCDLVFLFAVTDDAVLVGKELRAVRALDPPDVDSESPQRIAAPEVSPSLVDTQCQFGEEHFAGKLSYILLHFCVSQPPS